MEPKLQEFSAALPDGVVVLNEEDKIEWWNKTAERLLQLDNSQHAGGIITEIVTDPAFVNFIKEKSSENFVKLPAPNKPRMILKFYILPYGSKSYLLIVRDITRIDNLEKMRQEFVANVSHELRTPLTVLKGYIESFSDHKEEFSEQWQTALKEMSQQSERMEHLIKDLLLLSRLEVENPDSGNQEWINMESLLTAIRDDAVALSGEKKHNINLDIASDSKVYGQEGELRTAFSNIIFNAVRYTPADGEINISWYKDKAGAHLSVQDSGKGIASKHIPRLTHRFYRVDKSRQSGGTGLGLAIAKHVLMRHDAILHIESEEGKGSTFRCDFPMEKISK